jgi:DNA polymerase-3 subunit chi
MRIDFYEMAGRFIDPLEVACVLVGKAFPAVAEIAVVGSREQLAALDERLWKKPAGRFLPHGIDDEAAPIRLTETAPARSGLLINLDADSPLPAGAFQRVLEIVPPGEDARPALRKRWVAWKKSGAEMHHHVLK